MSAIKSAVIYTRFSPRPNAKDCVSCETQKELCEAFCKAKLWPVVAYDSDAGLSGAKYANRPGLQMALHHARKHRAVLVVYSLSRLSRNLFDTLKITKQIKESGADLASVSEPFDTSNATGELVLQLLAVMAEFERKQISERTSDAMLRHQADGRCMSNRLPYGKMRNPKNKRLMFDSAFEQEVIRKIIAWSEMGVSLRRIVELLNENGIAPRSYIVKNRTKYPPWHHSKIAMILKRAARDGIYKKSE
jgi:site-specific DNA recombinase